MPRVDRPPNRASRPPLAVDEALKAITVNETRQIGFDDRASTFEPGTEADPTILESDPYKTDPE
jgi:predicted amidohydrolase YtcJ